MLMLCAGNGNAATLFAKTVNMPRPYGLYLLQPLRSKHYLDRQRLGQFYCIMPMPMPMPISMSMSKSKSKSKWSRCWIVAWASRSSLQAGSAARRVE